MHAQRVIQTFAAIVFAATFCRAQAPQAARPAPVAPTSFSFTKVDLDLLNQSDQLDRQLQEKGLVFNDSETTRYLTKVGQSVLPSGAAPQSVHWQFFILRDPSPNAFALPNGSIYMHTGLLAVIQNEAQLAGVLAHEETHVLDHHGYLGNRNARAKTEAITILAGAASMGSMVGSIGEQYAVSLALQYAVPTILESTINGYSRELEKEADVRGVHAMVDANYSAREMKTLFGVLQRPPEVDLNTKTKLFYQDHPKLNDRMQYVGELADSLQGSAANTLVEADAYLIETESAVRHDADLEIRSGKPRTAVWAMERIVKRDDKQAENFSTLGDAYRGLGPRTPEPQASELTQEAKNETRKQMSKMTSEEYEAVLLKAPGGRQTLDSNRALAENNYKRALTLSPDLAAAHRGLGYLYASEHRLEDSRAEFRKYLELSPSAVDSPQIKRRIEAIEKETAGMAQTPQGK